MKCIILLKFFILLSLPLLTVSPITAIRHKKPISYTTTLPISSVRSTPLYKRDNAKRGLDVDLNLKMPTTANNKEIEILEKEIEIIEKRIKGDKLGDSDYRTEKGNLMPPLLLKPSFECDFWDFKTRTCWVDRNTGGTVTFSLTTDAKNSNKRSEVVWKREFAQRDSPIMKEYVINPRNSTRNLVIGRSGYELRVSPITEIDVDDNMFSASFPEIFDNSSHDTNNDKQDTAKVNFKIRIIAEDLGFVYIGETIDLAIGSYVTLPLESMTYHWYTEKLGELATLPSNMRVSTNGETLRISELRQDQEGIIACSVFTNRDVHATKKRFLLKELSHDKDILKAFSDDEPSVQKETHQRHKKTFKYSGEHLSYNQTKPTQNISTERKSKKQPEIHKADLHRENHSNFRASHVRNNNQVRKLQSSKTFLNTKKSSQNKERAQSAKKEYHLRKTEIREGNLEGDSYIFRPSQYAKNNRLKNILPSKRRKSTKFSQKKSKAKRKCKNKKQSSKVNLETDSNTSVLSSRYSNYNKNKESKMCVGDRGLIQQKSAAKRKFKNHKKLREQNLEGDISISGRLNQHANNNKFRKKQVNKHFPSNTKSTKNISSNKRKFKRREEISEADLEGDSYTIVRPLKDTKDYFIKKLQPIKRYPERDIYPMGPLYGGMNMDFSNTTDMGTIINIDFNKEMNIQDDNVAGMISSCVRDIQCSKHATCVSGIKSEGFCRCSRGYYGPGIFCREEM